MTDARTGVEAADSSTTTLEIDFLYIDLDTCRRCGGTDVNLHEAIELTRPALATAGIGNR